MLMNISCRLVHQPLSQVPRGAFSNPDSYFHHYSQLPESEAIAIATGLWNEINGLNLRQNILPTRERASLIMTKGSNHAIESVRLRK